MVTIGMPKLSDSMEEGIVVTWLVDDGATVARGEAIAEIETDKATMTFEAEQDGTLHHAVAEGTAVAVGDTIARLLAAGERLPEQPADDHQASPNGGATHGAAAPVVAAVPAGAAAAAPTAANGGERVKASPVARRLALAQHIDLAQLTGTGPRGRVVKADVQAALAQSTPNPDTSASPPPEPVASAKGAIETIELTRVQQVVARRMAESKSTVPDFAVRMYVDMDDAVALREQLRPHADGRLPSYNDFVIKAAALALREHPRANGAYRDGRFELYDRVNVGMAVAAQDALLVPTVVDADVRSIGTIAKDTRALAAAARDGKLSAAQLSGGTFTVSNLGMFGVESFVAVINPPQAAILAVGSVEQTPVVRDGAVGVGHRMSLTLTSDHRILYGAEAAAFLSTIRDLLQQPTRLLL